MTGVESNDRLIQRLGADLTPVRRLPAPVARALAWLAIVTAIAVVLATFPDVRSGEPATFGVNGSLAFGNRLSCDGCIGGGCRVRVELARSETHVGAFATAGRRPMDRR